MIAECKNLIQNNDIKSKNSLTARSFGQFSLRHLVILDLNLLFQLLDRIPNVDPLLANLEAYVVSEGLMVMKANSDTITTVSQQRPAQVEMTSQAASVTCSSRLGSREIR